MTSRFAALDYAGDIDVSIQTIALTLEHSTGSTTSISSIKGQEQDWSEALAFTLAQAAEDRKGGDILILKVTEVSYLADYFVLVTGFSRTQVRAILEAMVVAAATHCHRSPRGREGESEATWVVLDYGDVIAHVLTPEQREFYNLEAFWGHAERVEFSPDQPQSVKDS